MRTTRSPQAWPSDRDIKKLIALRILWAALALAVVFAIVVAVRLLGR